MSKIWLTASDLASLVVCPESFRLKQLAEEKHSAIRSESKAKSREARVQWISKQSMLTNFKRYRRMVFGLLFVLLGLAAIGELLLKKGRLNWAVTTGRNNSTMLAGIPVDLFVLVVILGVGTMLWDIFERKSRSIAEEIGLDPLSASLGLGRSSVTSGDDLISEKLMLKSRPHAFILEEKMRIPLDIHPSTDKVRDRHVVQLLTHLQILSGISSTPPPHGYLLMGSKKRLVKIAFDEERQKWIREIYEQATGILSSNSATAAPEKYKCRGCDVRNLCNFRIDS